MAAGGSYLTDRPTSKWPRSLGGIAVGIASGLNLLRLPVIAVAFPPPAVV